MAMAGCVLLALAAGGDGIHLKSRADTGGFPSVTLNVLLSTVSFISGENYSRRSFK